MPTAPSWSHVASEQQRIAKLAWEDEDNRNLILLALAAGVVSSVALGKLYAKLTEDTEDDDLRSLAGTGLVAIGLGVLSVMWKLNKAQFQLPIFSASLPALDSLTPHAGESLEEAGFTTDDWTERA